MNKWSNEGPAAWVVPSDDPRPVGAANLMDLLQIQGVEIQKTSGDMEVAQKSGKVKIPAGSYVVRMDQPYSRMADMLLDTQYYNVNDPPPYDDTGWTLGALHNVKTIRVTDAAILKAPMSMVAAPAKFEGSVTGAGSAVAYLINNNTDNTLFTFRYRLKNVKMSALEAPYSAGAQKFNAGTFVIKTDGAPSDLRAQLDSASKDLGLKVVAVSEMPKTAMHDIPAPRIALIHTWTNTQNEGWYRIAFDQLHIPYDYIADQKLKTMTDLRSKYDVILFGPVGGNAQSIVNGRSTVGEPIPFKASTHHAESGRRSGYYRRYAAGDGPRRNFRAAQIRGRRRIVHHDYRERYDSDRLWICRGRFGAGSCRAAGARERSERGVRG